MKFLAFNLYIHILPDRRCTLAEQKKKEPMQHWGTRLPKSVVCDLGELRRALGMNAAEMITWLVEDAKRRPEIKKIVEMQKSLDKL